MTEIELSERIVELLSDRPNACPQNNYSRRKLKGKRKNERLKIVASRGYYPWIGYVKGEFDLSTGQFILTGTYVKRPKNSNRQKYLKRCTSKRVRKEPWLPVKGNHYRKVHEYQWELD